MKNDKLKRLGEILEESVSRQEIAGGIVDLWDPVEKYIPEFANMMVTADRTVDMGAVKAKRSVTVKDCMNMTSGLPYGCDPDPSSRDVGKVFDELDRRLYSDNPMTTVELAKRLGGCRLDSQYQTVRRIDWQLYMKVHRMDWLSFMGIIWESVITWIQRLLLNPAEQVWFRLWRIIGDLHRC